MIFKLDVNQGIYICSEEEEEMNYTNRNRVFQRRRLCQDLRRERSRKMGQKCPSRASISFFDSCQGG